MLAPVSKMPLKINHHYHQKKKNDFRKLTPRADNGGYSVRLLNSYLPTVAQPKPVNSP
jgi:hypothetical protein